MKRLYASLFLILVTLIAVGCTTVSTSGDYTLSGGKTLQGNLIITSGNATLEAGSRVTGDVLLTSGNLAANGEIDGDIVMSSGNVTLGPEAVVRGDIRATSGNVRQAEGAQVQGQISTNQSTFSIGGGFFASLFFLLCVLPLLLIGGLVLLMLVWVRRKPTAVPEKQAVPAISAEKLKQLKHMLDEGLITEAEYEEKKAKILAEM